MISMKRKCIGKLQKFLVEYNYGYNNIKLKSFHNYKDEKINYLFDTYCVYREHITEQRRK